MNNFSLGRCIGDIARGRKIGYGNGRKHIWVACIDCGKERWVPLCKDKPRNLRCSSCGAKNRERQFGKDSANWKGGKIRCKGGYIRVWASPTSFYAEMRGNRGYIFEHRLIMAQHLGRCLESWEVVHHKNHIRDDNRLENLSLHKISDHQAITILEAEVKRLREKNEKLKEENKRLNRDCFEKYPVKFNIDGVDNIKVEK